MSLIHDPIFLLLLIIVLGELLGKVRFFGFVIGPAATIFVALAFGHFGFLLPEGIRTVGLALFIYAVALQSAPGFFNSFRNHGLAMALCALAVAATGALSAYAASLIFGFDHGTVAGLMAGGMTSTPALAVAVDLLGPGAATAAYGVTYGFGVLGVALFVQLLPRLSGRKIKEEEATLKAALDAENPPISYIHLEITNPEIAGRRVDSLKLQAIAPVTITRLLCPGATEPVLVRGDTVFALGDRIRIAGRPDDLAQISPFLGHPVEKEIAFDRVLSKKSIIVSRRKIVGKTLGYFNVREVFNVQITRVTRNGIDLPPVSDLRLHLGDVLHAVGDERALENLTRIIGNDLKATYEIGMLPILTGLLVGFALSRVTLPLPLLGDFTLGTTGGVLIAGLVLGSLYSTGPLIWDVPASGNRLIRDLGLALFMAAVGTAAGGTLLATLQAQGLSLFVSGVAVTILPLCVGAALGLLYFRINFLRMLGVLVGAMTSASGLAAANNLSPTPYAAAAYATVYPLAMIAKIVAVKILVMLL